MKTIHARQSICFILLSIFCSCGTMNANKLRYHKVAKENSDVTALQIRSAIPEEKSRKHKEPEFISSEVMGEEITASMDNNAIPAFETRVFKKNMERECDVILLRNGEEISAKVLVVGIGEIIYEKCEVIHGSEYKLLKKDVFMITYSNGSKDVFKENTQKVVVEKEEEAIIEHAHIGGVMSLILGILSVTVGAFLLWPVTFFGIPAFILGVVGVSETASHPEEYKGMAPSVFGIIFGLVGMVLLVLSLLIFL